MTEKTGAPHRSDGALGRLKSVPREKLVRAACYLGFASMAMMVWSVLDPRPLPVMMAMSVGQGGALLAFALYLAAVLLRHDGASRDGSDDD